MQFSAEARKHLHVIGEYTEEVWGIEQRDLYLAQLYKGFEAIRKSPLIGRTRVDIDAGLRSKQIRKHIAYYFVETNSILIVGVLHERMDPARHL